MIQTVIKSYRKRYLSTWTVLFIDAVLVALCYLFSVFMWDRLGSDGIILTIGFWPLMGKTAIVVLTYTFFFYIFKVNKGILRHTTIHEGVVILKASAFATFLLIGYAAYWNKYHLEFIRDHHESLLYLPRIPLLFHFTIVNLVLIAYRMFIKDLFDKFSRSMIVNSINVLIYGAGSSGQITYAALRRDRNTVYNILGFIDDDKQKQGKKIDGVEILSEEKALKKIEQEKVDQVIISMQNLRPSLKKEIIGRFLQYDVLIKDVPAVENWLNEELTTNQIKNVNVEDLLGRNPITLDSKNIHQEIEEKTVLVSGAAGSIGSEIVRQLIHFNPQKVIAVDQAESFLYDLQTEIKNGNPNLFNKIEFIIANVKDISRMNHIFETYRPQIVYHAAAYKHVPLMEEYPFEAFKVNILGTKNLADLSVQYNVEKFVMVSTDKAVNPTNVMGATKRIAEIYTQSLDAKQENTHFVTTRFGNVLGSNGSVIPLFKKQIEKGGPITLTHKDITRYFMTIPEACNLVLEAGTMGNGGEIFVFDMGESVKIYDLAINMIKLSGLKPHTDIKIEEVGLRPGEKLYEELLSSEENTLSTHHEKIMRAKVRQETFETVEGTIISMKSFTEGQEEELIRTMKKLVPEYKSNNSRFEKLDK